MANQDTVLQALLKASKAVVQPQVEALVERGKMLDRLVRPQIELMSGITPLRALYGLLQAPARPGTVLPTQEAATALGQELIQQPSIIPALAEGAVKALARPSQQAQQQAQPQKVDVSQLDPVTQAGIKAAQKAKTQQVEEAVRADVQPEQIQDQLLRGQQQQQQPSKTREFILNTLIASSEAMQGLTPGTLRRAQLENKLLQQRLAGEVPLQQGERDSRLLDLKNSLDIESMQGLSGEATTKLTQLLEGRDSVTQLDSMLEDNVTAQLFEQNLPNFLKSQQGKGLESLLLRAVAPKLRIESGAKISKEEIIEESRKYLPRKGDSSATYRRRLAPLFDFYNRGLAVLDPAGTHTRRAMGARESFARQQGGQQTQPGTIKITEIKEIK